jgi:hypothetical protein
MVAMGNNLALAHVAENEISGNKLAVDHGINADILREVHIIHIFNQGYRARYALFLGQQTRNNIRFGVSRHGNKGIHVFKAFAFQEFLIAAIAPE